MNKVVRTVVAHSNDDQAQLTAKYFPQWAQSPQGYRHALGLGFPQQLEVKPNQDSSHRYEWPKETSEARQKSAVSGISTGLHEEKVEENSTS